ncbi:DUF6884 domain-containing protein [Microlunatus flavus]|nr:DUF6884 domain-containing protein [Microlunatus flavus]
MADWSPLRERLRSIDDEVTMSWQELDELVGGLPPSAYEHRAFWGGKRSGWSGFSASQVQVGRSVTFLRRTDDSSGTPAIQRAAPDLQTRSGDVVLVGCVKSKLDHPAAARDLYTSTLFRKARAHAEGLGKPWFILSAEHGLIDPDTTIAPYDLRLANTSLSYRQRWGTQVVERLSSVLGPLDRLVVEVHAGRAYVDAVRGPLTARGVAVLDPLLGLRQGERQQWYRRMAAKKPEHPAVDFEALITQLADRGRARRPSELDRKHLLVPGLYSWWVDDTGAADLEGGLRHPVHAGLIYIGLAGAAKNTLWGRLVGMHLGKRHSFSTLRRTLGAVLAELRGDPAIDEPALTAWMHDHSGWSHCPWPTQQRWTQPRRPSLNSWILRSTWRR